MSEFRVPIQDFLLYLSYFGTHLDNPHLNAIMAEQGLTDRDELTETEMGNVLYALGEAARRGLESLDDPAAKSYARLMNLASGVVDLVVAPH